LHTIERRLYRPVEAAEAIGVGRATIYRLIAEGRIATVVINERLRVSAAEIDRIAAEGVPSLGPAEVAVGR
jgi:excisionase family DNA binding protein